MFRMIGNLFWLAVIIIGLMMYFTPDDSAPARHDAVASQVSTQPDAPVDAGPSPYDGEDVEWKRCNLASAMISSSAGWRDDGVPLLRSQNNVINALNYPPPKVRITGSWPYKWRNLISKIYQSHVSESELFRVLRSYCKKDVSDVNGKLYDATLRLVH